MNLDLFLFQGINGLAGRFAWLDFVGIFFAQYLAYFLLFALGLFLFFERNWKIRFYQFSFIALTAILARGIVTEATRFFFYRSRPPAILNIDSLIALPNGAGFPSGHAAIFFGLAAALYFFRKRWGIWFFVGAIFMGLARIFVGVHWPSDIAGGALVGVICAFAVRRFLSRYFPSRNENEKEIHHESR